MARIAALVPDLMFASRVEATLRTSGHDVEFVSAVESIEGDGERPDLVIVDLGEIDASELAGRGLPVLGFYSHVEVETRRRAEAAGIDLVVPRSRMARDMPALVESLLS